MIKKLALATALALIIVTVFALLLQGHTLAVLSPQGLIAAKERSLIILATLLMLLVVVPVFILTFTIAWKYRAGNPKATYTPEWSHHTLLELTWWAIPCAIIGILAVITWTSSHDLDPFQPLDTATRPLTVQVVALQWKWLFIYPEQHIASLNQLEIPAGTPVSFEITSDAPMNSFWIPQLGGQVYAMSGMSTQLHLVADQPGTYRGVSANLSGRGFAGMSFTTKATSQAEFDQWVKAAQQSSRSLGLDAYGQLARPSEHDAPAVYRLTANDLYDRTIRKYMMPADQPAAEVAP
jgi:cytochrome o ubiquinol oxidase subunit II